MSEHALSHVSYPRRALRPALFLIAIECLMLAYPSGSWGIMGGLGLWAASRWWTIRSGWCLSTPVIWNSLFLFVISVIKFAFAPAHFPVDAGFANTELAHEIGCWLVATQILILHDVSTLKRVPLAVAGLGCLAILCAGDVQLHSVSRGLMLGLMVLFVGGLGWFAHAGRDWIKLDERRRLRRGILLATLVLAGVPTVYAAQAWHLHERELEMVLIQMMHLLDGGHNESRMRFRSALMHASNGKIVDPEKLVLRVTQDSPDPVYYRGTALSLYPQRSLRPRINSSNRYRELDLTVRLESQTAPPGRGLPPDEPLFVMSPSNATHWSKSSIEYLSKEDPIPLAPLHTGMIKIDVKQLRKDAYLNLSLRDEVLPDSLTTYVPIPLGIEEMPGLKDDTRNFPEGMDHRVVSLAESLYRDKTTDTEKIQATEQYFQENYQYQLGFIPPPGEDPMLYFLTQRPPAHCEYFAGGAALLLRLGGIPTRYVTGYVPSERHPDGVWIARRKDAHAWAEAYDSHLQQWVTVEATPSIGLPARRDASWMNSMQEFWRTWQIQFLERLGKLGVWSALMLVLENTAVRIVLGVLLAVGWWGGCRRFRRRSLVSAKSYPTREFPFQHWLRELESDLRLHGLIRQPQETLLQFRQRILVSPLGEQLRAAAEWYAEYSLIRYNEPEQTDSRIAQLELSWKNLALKPLRS